MYISINIFQHPVHIAPGSPFFPSRINVGFTMAQPWPYPKREQYGSNRGAKPIDYCIAINQQYSPVPFRLS